MSVIRKSADALAGALTNTLLFSFYLYGASFGKRGSRGMYEMVEEAHSALEEFNYQSIKNALNQLTKTGLINRSQKRSQLEITITNEGKRRIAELFPVYQANRPWDGHVYLISYDIPAKSNKTRNLLRNYIRRTGGALLQESLWINPYNPQSIIKEFVEKRTIPGTILISKLGKDGAIGDKQLSDLIARVYKYDELADRYNTFIQKHGLTKKPSPIAIAFEYISILRDDPQLPFDLEPKDFSGRRAHELFEKIRKKFSHSSDK